MDDMRRSERGRNVSDSQVFGTWQVSPWSPTSLRRLRGCASAKLTAGARVAHRVPKASFGGAMGPPLTALFHETIE